MLQKCEQEFGKPRHRMRFVPMEELVSCILSQSSSDKSSFPAFTRLLERYPTWDLVIHAPQSEVADTIRAAGLANQKAANIQATLAKILELNGSFTLEPLRAMSDDDALAWLMGLPGVGPKTASIVLCFCFGRATIPVDTHVQRVSTRLGILPESLTLERAHETLRRSIPVELSFSYHTLLIQLGRKVCHAKSPECGKCRVADVCKYCNQNMLK